MTSSGMSRLLSSLFLYFCQGSFCNVSCQAVTQGRSPPIAFPRFFYYQPWIFPTRDHSVKCIFFYLFIHFFPPCNRIAFQQHCKLNSIYYLHYFMWDRSAGFLCGWWRKGFKTCFCYFSTEKMSNPKQFAVGEKVSISLNSKKKNKKSNIIVLAFRTQTPIISEKFMVSFLL